MYLILLREKKYLTGRYEWSDLPALFPVWRAEDVTNLMFGHRIKQKPTGWAVVSSKSVDLDKLEVMRF